MARVPLASEVDFSKRKGYNVQLDDLLLRTATGPDRVLQIQSAEFPQQSINLAVNPEDITTNVGQIFSRSNFSGGEGLIQHIKEMVLKMILQDFLILKVLMYFMVMKKVVIKYIY